MQLRRLAALERQKIIDELAKIELEIADLKDILAKPERQRAIVRDELKEIVDKYGDDRRTRIIAADGDVSRRGSDRPRGRGRHDHRDRLRQAHQDRPVPQPEARRQGRAGRRAQAGRHRQALLRLLDPRLDPVLHHEGPRLPGEGVRAAGGRRTARGQHVANLLAFQPDERIAQVIQIQSYEDAPYLVLATRNGLVKKSKLTDFDSNRCGGIVAINLRGEDELVGAVLCSADDDLLLVSAQGQSIRFSATDEALRPMGRATSGVQGMRFNGGRRTAVAERRARQAPICWWRRRVGTRSAPPWRITRSRAAAEGRADDSVRQARGTLVGALIVDDDDELYAITSGGGSSAPPPSRSARPVGRPRACG